MRRTVRFDGIRPGDLIIDLGIEVTYSEPWADHVWIVEGTIVYVDDNKEADVFTTTVKAPNSHLVRITRSA